MHRLSIDEARRLAVVAQRLDADRPADIVETVESLMVVNIDPTAAIAPSADHILWSRIGWPYQSADLRRAADVDRSVFEWSGFYRPMTDLPLYRERMAAWPPYEKHRTWLEVNARFRGEVIDRLRAEGPLTAAEIPDTAQVSWTSSGWTNGRNVTQMLEFLALRGEIAVSRRDGRDRVWDLAERVFDDASAVSAEDAWSGLARRRLASLGIARETGVKQPVEPVDVGSIGEPAVVDGVAGEWRIDPTLLDGLSERDGRVALLSPFDRLVFDRDRLRELFGFEYVLEMYKPASARRWGYFVLPVLVGFEFAARLDAKVDRRAGRLAITALHEERPLGDDEREAIADEIDELAAWLGVEPTGALLR